MIRFAVESEDDDPGDRIRPREALRRVLVLIDQLASVRVGIHHQDLRRRVVDVTGIPVHWRTIYRDLQLLEAMNLAERTNNAGWRLLNRSRNIQSIATEVSN